MKKFLFVFCAFFLMFFAQAQEADFSFPENALGSYSGTLFIDSPRGKQEVPMEFHMKKTDSLNKYIYQLVYNGQARDYSLIIKDKQKGICEVDENNGIILPSRFSGNTLYSFFEVQGNFLSSRLEFKEDHLFFEILFSNTKAKTTTGGTSDKIPKIYGYPITVVQKAILKKTN